MTSNKNGARCERRFAVEWILGQRLFTVATNRFHGAASESFFTEAFLVVVFWLFVNVGVTAVVVTLEVGRGGFAAEIAVNALIVYVVSSGGVLWVFVCGVGHVFVPLFVGCENRLAAGGVNGFFGHRFDGGTILGMLSGLCSPKISVRRTPNP